MIEIAHQRRAGIARRHLLRRTAHVDVDDLGACGIGGPGPFGHPSLLTSGELHDMGSLPRRLRPQVCLGVADRQLVARDHFRNHKAGAVLPSQPAEGRVADARHGRHEHAIAELDPANGQRFGQFGDLASINAGPDCFGYHLGSCPFAYILTTPAAGASEKV